MENFSQKAAQGAAGHGQLKHLQPQHSLLWRFFNYCLPWLASSYLEILLCSADEKSHFTFRPVLLLTHLCNGREFIGNNFTLSVHPSFLGLSSPVFRLASSLHLPPPRQKSTRSSPQPLKGSTSCVWSTFDPAWNLVADFLLFSLKAFSHDFSFKLIGITRNQFLAPSCCSSWSESVVSFLSTFFIFRTVRLFCDTDDIRCFSFLVLSLVAFPGCVFAWTNRSFAHFAVFTFH